MKTHTFHVKGMHCKSCVLVTESELEEISYVSRAKSSLKHHSVEVTGDFGDRELVAIAAELSKVLEPKGYSLSVEKYAKEKKISDFAIAVPLAGAFMVFFLALQKMGLVNFITSSEVSYSTAFVIGIIASLSTCMAVVGGLVLAMSATFAKEGDKVRPQFLFHAGRITSFFVLGGVIGAIGSAFQLGYIGSAILGIIIAVVMLLLGINLLDVFHWSKKLQPAMPKFLARHAFGISKMNHALTPLLVGIATFFLPCGFTQAMQIYTLSTGSFLRGGLTMLCFALGTLPVLALVGCIYHKCFFECHGRGFL